MGEAGWAAALELTRQTWRRDAGRGQSEKEPDTPTGPAIRKVKGYGAPGAPARPDRGLLLLYALDPKLAEADLPEIGPPVVAFGISFPGSNNGVKVEYKVNTVLWDLEYGASE